MKPYTFIPPKEITFIQQRGLFDCTVACLAMVYRKTYEEVLEKLNELNLQEKATTIGLTALETAYVGEYLLKNSVIMYVPVGGLVTNREYILVVPSSFEPNKHTHAIVYSTYEKIGRIYDPAKDSIIYQTMRVWFEPLEILYYIQH